MYMVILKTWSRAVWKEDDNNDREEECVIPSYWISMKKMQVRWPMKGMNVIKAMNDKRVPDENWLTFDLKKVKFSSDSKRECEDYDQTTTTELSDDEETVGKRIPKKKCFPEFQTDNTEEENYKQNKGKKTIVNLPPPPKQPVPTKPVNLPPPPKQPAPTIQEYDPAAHSSSFGRSLSRSASRSRSLSAISRSRSPECPSTKSSTSFSLFSDYRRSTSRPRSDNARRRQKGDSCYSRRTQQSRSRSRSYYSSPTYHNSLSRESTKRRMGHRYRSRSPRRPSICRSPSPRRHNRQSTCRSPKRHNRPSRSPSPRRHNRPSRSPSPRRHNRQSRSPRRHNRQSRSPRRYNERSNSRNSRSSCRSPSIPRIYRRRHIDENQGKTSKGPMTEEKFQRKLLYYLVEIRDILKRESAKEENKNNYSQMETMEQFKDFDRLLKKNEEFDKCKKYVIQIGGRDTTDHLKKAMQRFMSNRVMSYMNMTGKNEKMAFKETKLFQAIRDAVLASHGTSETVILDECSKFLKYAPKRSGGLKIS